MSKVSRLFDRLRARLRALVGGYFWLPCPRCGEHFGGHERGGGIIWRGFEGQLCCPRCPGDSGFVIDGGGDVRQLPLQEADAS